MTGKAAQRPLDIDLFDTGARSPYGPVRSTRQHRPQWRRRHEEGISMFKFLRRWLAGDPPGSPSNPLVCGTPFLMEKQRELLAQTVARLAAERQAAGVTLDPELADRSYPYPAGQLLVTPARNQTGVFGGMGASDLALLRWTPQLSSEWSGKVSDDEDEAILHGRVQA